MHQRHIGWVLAGAAGAQIFSATCIALFPVIAPRLAAHLRVDPSLTGYQMSILFAVAMAVGPFVATIVLRHDGCRAMQWSALAAAAGMAIALWGTLAAVAAAWAVTALFATIYAHVGHYTTVFGLFAVVAAAGRARTCLMRFIDLQ